MITPKHIIICLLIMTVFLQARLWVDDASLINVYKMHRTLATQQRELDSLQQRNAELQNRIASIKSYPNAIEEQARYELGMVKQGEKYYQVLEPIE